VTSTLPYEVDAADTIAGPLGALVTGAAQLTDRDRGERMSDTRDKDA
jgi:hypothetical protein